MKLHRKKQQLVKKLQLKNKVLRVKSIKKNSKKKLKLKFCKKNLCDFSKLLMLILSYTNFPYQYFLIYCKELYLYYKFVYNMHTLKLALGK